MKMIPWGQYVRLRCGMPLFNENSSVVTIPNVAMRYVSRYLGHDAIRIAILVYRVSQCLDLHKKNCKHP